MSAYARYPSLQDRCVLITGGATGIGETLVTAFAEQGAKVAFIDLAADEGHVLAARLSGSRHAPQFAAADLSNVEALRSAIASLRERSGPFSVLLNNAAHDKRHAVEDTTPEFWDASVAVNLKHQFFAAQAVLPDMKALGGGSIVNFGSISWMLKQGGMPAYTSSKAAAQGLTRCLARDFGPHNIRANAIAPGLIRTDFARALWENPKIYEASTRNCPLRRIGEPNEIAGAALYLASNEGRFCTGHTMVIDGGVTIGDAG